MPWPESGVGLPHSNKHPRAPCAAVPSQHRKSARGLPHSPENEAERGAHFAQSSSPFPDDHFSTAR